MNPALAHARQGGVDIHKGHRPFNVPSIRGRAFEEVKTRNYAAQRGTLRYPRTSEGLPDNVPRFLGWRLNLVALSAIHNLYFTACVDRILVFVPRDLRNTIPGKPDLILHLPRSFKATQVGGYIVPSVPHGINNIKIGDLGDLEILLVACDDGDVVAFYTHLINHEVQLAMNEGHTTPPIKLMRPDFLQNVGISAWGLAIHTQSRLIAVGSNLKQITVFAPACNEPPKHEFHNDHSDPPSQTSSDSRPRTSSSFEEYSTPTRTTPKDDGTPSWWANLSYHEREVFRKPNWLEASSLSEGRLCSNIVIRVTLPLIGHNIPSVDFTSDGEGEALAVIAADINGNSWQYGLYSSRLAKLPTMIDEITHDEDKMGWGVIAIPPGMIKEELLPHAALGSWKIMESWRLDSRLVPNHACFDITHSLSEFEHTSGYHPAFGALYLNQEGRRKEQHIPSLENDEGSDDFLPFDGRVITKAFKEKFKELLQPDHASFWTFDIFWKEKDDLLQAVPDLKDDIIPAHRLAGELALVRGISVHPVKAIQQFLLMPPEARNCQTHLNFEEFMETYQRKEGKSFPGAEHEKRERKPLPLSSSHSAILMCHLSDIHFMPADDTLPPTICKGILRQIMPPNILGILGQYDRLCMHALIPDLSIIVIATQAGRAALITPTQMSAHMSEAVTMRVELLLPLKKDEDADRPWDQPLLGMAVAPVWRGEKVVEGEEWKAWRGERNVRAKAWRLFLHYMDHTILTYELFRGEKEDLVVF
ncbi:hypothetical protein BDZ45DRAFT_720071 [Acephala macrosclerotiorum]|nr:hypothetical protein BDZ45DRAFT_720071 [Acephala macrosclerotiorum]